VRKRLHGGHSDGRVVEVDDPAPPYLQVPYRVPADPLDPNVDDWAALFGVDTYELVEVIPVRGPRVREYLCQPWQ